MFSRVFAFFFIISVAIAAIAQSALPVQGAGESQFSLTDKHLKAVGLRFDKGVNSIRDFVQQTATYKETQEIRLSWDAFPGMNSPITATEASRLQISPKFVAMSRQFLTDSPAHQADGHMYSDTFLFVATGKSGRVRGLVIQRDPRLMFLDTAGRRGRLTGGMLYKPKAEFALRFPNSPDIKRVLVFQPRHNTTGYRLELLAAVDLKKIKQ